MLFIVVRVFYIAYICTTRDYNFINQEYEKTIDNALFYPNSALGQ